MNIPPRKTRYGGGCGFSESALTAWKAWIALAGSAVVLAGLYTRW